MAPDRINLIRLQMSSRSRRPEVTRLPFRFTKQSLGETKTKCGPLLLPLYSKLIEERNTDKPSGQRGAIEHLCCSSPSVDPPQHHIHDRRDNLSYFAVKLRHLHSTMYMMNGLQSLVTRGFLKAGSFWIFLERQEVVCICRFWKIFMHTKKKNT